MITDVVFPIFAASDEWHEAFEKMNYDAKAVNKLFGSPYISNQHPEVKVRDGIYYTGLNPEHNFRDAGLDVYPSYHSGHQEGYNMYKYREENQMEWISPYLIGLFYQLAMFGHTDHINHGLCDNPDQILAKWPHLETSKQKHFITLTPIYKSDQSPSGGFRFHKWGTYIGEHELQYEYLYDEEEIDIIYVFHIHTLKVGSGLGAMSIEEAS